MVAAGTLSAPAAHADGVIAGTLIENVATASYESGSGTQTVTSNKVTLKVDELLDVTVVATDASAIELVNTAYLSFEITNTGNGPEAFNLNAIASVAGNAFDADIVGIAIDTNGSGAYEEGVDQILGAAEATDEIDPGASLTVFVLVATPGGIADGALSAVKLTADAVTGTGAPGDTFVGRGLNGSDAVVGATNADALASGGLIARLIGVSLVKSAVVADPFGGTAPVPGATITYTITAQVTGSGTINALRVTDAIPTGTTLTAGTLKLDTVALTDAADADAGTADSSGVEVQLGNVTGGTEHSVSFAVTIN